MNGLNITELETQNHGKDWPLIVTAISCETCGAEVGQPCREVSVAANPMLQIGKARIDYHATRKTTAAQLWYSNKHLPEAPAGEQPGLPSAADLDADAEEKRVVEATATTLPVSEQEETPVIIEGNDTTETNDVT